MMRMRRFYRFLSFAGWLVFTQELNVFFFHSYIFSVVFAIITSGLLYIRAVQEHLRLEPISAGLVYLITSALGVLFIKDNVFEPISVVAVVTIAIIFALTYLLFQGRLERN